MSKQSFPAALRILQEVATLAGADDSLAAINTNIVSDRAIVAVAANNSLYMLRKDSVVAASSPNIIAPTSDSPGRWFLYGAGPSATVEVDVSHAVIPPNTTIESAFTLAGLSDGADIVIYNSFDSGLPAGVVTGPVRVTGANAAVMRFGNLTAVTVAAATVAFRMAVQQG